MTPKASDALLFRHSALTITCRLERVIFSPRRDPSFYDYQRHPMEVQQPTSLVELTSQIEKTRHSEGL